VVKRVERKFGAYFLFAENLKKKMNLWHFELMKATTPK
jgi:hypothetical protein